MSWESRYRLEQRSKFSPGQYTDRTRQCRGAWLHHHQRAHPCHCRGGGKLWDQKTPINFSLLWINLLITPIDFRSVTQVIFTCTKNTLIW